MKQIETDVFVLGAGAGGIGCVYRLLKNGIKTVVVDKNNDFGGTMVFGGVDGWEPGVSLDGMHTLLYEELCKIENGCHVVEVVPNINIFCPDNGYDWSKHSFSERPWGLSVPTGKAYDDTMKRCTFLRGNASCVRLQFDSEYMPTAVRRVLEPYADSLTELFGYSYAECKTENGKILSVTVTNGEEKVEVYAKYFVDCSGDIVLARSAGCEYAFGTEGKEAYGEPCADKESDNVNAVTYVFRVSPTEDKDHIDKIPDEYAKVDVSDFTEGGMRKRISCFTLYPNGDINVNMLPTLEGKEYFKLGDKADAVGRARVYRYWHFLQTERGMKGYRLVKIFDAGIRESYRLVGKYVLTENDVRAGLTKQPKVGRTVAIADHALDVHGSGGMCRELEIPYEIPLECTEAKEFDNLFVACRGASFSHIASASVRLSRTMLSLGEGVGEYISEIIK